MSYEAVGYYTDGRRAVAIFNDQAEAEAFCKANNDAVQADELVVETVLTWVIGEDIKAVRGADGVERLIWNGREVPLGEDDHHATQQVVNYAQAGKRGRLTLRRAWTEAGDVTSPFHVVGQTTLEPF